MTQLTFRPGHTQVHVCIDGFFLQRRVSVGYDDKSVSESEDFLSASP